ncbi:centromere protein P isoform X5 [Panthera tigris]|uniref:centromere protein P isoform X5 n=1 Tax=Panthera leo TaxID=9689 RepID=UPI001C6A4826|nr:centromere protein P isoform X5 [Panthera leo]XP_042819536.1 centromere protein P isoform X5 [Panthera tigris]
MDARRAEVRALEAEIAALRRACEEPRAPGEDTSRARKSLQEVHQSDSGEWAASKDLRGHLGHLESELLFLSTLTGINIINYSMKTEDLTSTENTEKSIKKVLQRHRLSGNCHMITFQLEFQILEIQNKESLSSVITDLNIIMEPTEYSELSEFVSRAEDRRDLLMFFRSLHFFVEWCEYPSSPGAHSVSGNHFLCSSTGSKSPSVGVLSSSQGAWPSSLPSSGPPSASGSPVSTRLQ